MTPGASPLHVESRWAGTRADRGAADSGAVATTRSRPERSPRPESSPRPEAVPTDGDAARQLAGPTPAQTSRAVPTSDGYGPTKERTRAPVGRGRALAHGRRRDAVAGSPPRLRTAAERASGGAGRLGCAAGSAPAPVAPPHGPRGCLALPRRILSGHPRIAASRSRARCAARARESAAPESDGTKPSAGAAEPWPAATRATGRSTERVDRRPQSVAKHSHEAASARRSVCTKKHFHEERERSTA